jgi:hypothetical protein
MAKDWKFQSNADKAYALFEHVNQSLFDGMLPQPVIGFDSKGRLKKAGDYSFEGDEISLKHHFNLRKDLTELELIMALIHNSIHLQSETYEDKKNWYHNKHFREKLETFGLLCDKNGDVSEVMLSKFGETLKMIGSGELIDELNAYEVSEALVVDDSPVAEESEVLVIDTAVKMPAKNGNKGSSKMKKWSCACTNIRAATLVSAQCTECGQDFLQEGSLILDTAVAAKPPTNPVTDLLTGWQCLDPSTECSVILVPKATKIDIGCYICGSDYAPVVKELACD